MKEIILYYDCFAGICGDMNLAAMVDLGVPAETLRSELSKLGLDGWTLRFTPDAKKGIHGTRADVDLLFVPARPATFAGSPRAAADHAHRSYKDIRALIEGSALSEPIKQKALAVFAKLAEAEAKVHAERVEDVLFHEVGAVDSIVDIVGAAICLDYLKPDKVLASRVELGGGFVQCRHGLIPVPAPAVVELLRGAPVRSGAVEAETTTPTGAAILAVFVDEWTDDKRFTISKSAYGVGHRDSDIPNLLRVFLGEREKVERGASAVLLECNIDDMSPEIHGHLFDRLLGAGAADVWLTPIVMKKSRSAVLLSVLCGEEAEDALAELILRETTTLGLRRSRVEKTALERETRLVPTSLGEISVKTAFLGGKAIRAKPEYEDLRRIASERGIPLIEVFSTVAREIG